MRKKRAHIASAPVEIEPFPLDRETLHADSQSWFVYLFALADCSAFKVGFSCNPLQRICTFSRRYFDRFDLSQSVLLKLDHCDLARDLEHAIKTELATFRAESPTWVPAEAGGHTEWFSAVYFGAAEAQLHSTMGTLEHAFASNAFDLLRADLERVRASFERWAFGCAQRLCDTRSYAQRGYVVRDQSTSLRDWLDAYRYFDLPLFAEEPAVLNYVRSSARLPVG